MPFGIELARELVGPFRELPCGPPSPASRIAPDGPITPRITWAFARAGVAISMLASIAIFSVSFQAGYFFGSPENEPQTIWPWRLSAVLCACANAAANVSNATEVAAGYRISFDLGA